MYERREMRGMQRIGQRLLRWSVLGLGALWVSFVVLLLTGTNAEGITADLVLTAALLLPTSWAYVRPGPVSGAVAVVVAWPLAALTVTAMIALPSLVVAEGLLLVAAVRRPLAVGDEACRESGTGTATGPEH